MAEIVWYHYIGSPVCHKIGWYLKLRGLPYTECVQSPILPRPDVIDLLGVGYRRIPVLAIGKDVLCDSRVMFKKLEEVFPGGLNTDDALTTLLDTWSMEILFPAAAMLIPVATLTPNTALIKDREEFSGRSWSPEYFTAHRAEGAAAMKAALTFINKSLLRGKKFIGGETPTLADIQAIWLFDWLLTMPGGLDNTGINKETLPQIFAWNERFRAAVGGPYKAAKKVKGEEAKRIIMAGPALPSIGVDNHDPIGLKEGEAVSVTPVDTARNHPTIGKLIGINTEEVVIRVRTGLPVHFPRRAFKIKRVTEGKL